MTLRGRLTTAFVAVVLGPVLLGSLFVGTTVAAVSRNRATERLDHAVTTVRTAIAAVCRQLQAAADTIAVLPESEREVARQQLLSRGLVSAFATGDDARWRDCADPARGGVTAISARAVTDAGTVVAALTLDASFVARLAASSGADVALAQQSPVEGDRFVRRVDIVPGQPLPLTVSVPAPEPAGLYALLTAGVLLAAAGAVLTARRLAHSTTRPLAELAQAADRVAAGELDTRVPVVRGDELGRLAGSFNRMTRELQAYVQALTASRDQLRGHLAILGDTLSSTHDLNRILRVILRTALSATGARAGIVLLTDPADGRLTARCAEGLTGRWDVPESDLPALRVPPGEGVLGTVAATGEPRRGRSGDPRRGPGDPRCGPGDPLGGPGDPRCGPGDPRRGPGDPPRGPGGPRPDEPACHNYVAVPILAPATVGEPLVPGEPAVTATPATIGVLALYDRLGAAEFDDADLLTLRTFAGQAGVAVHNVRVHEEAQRLSLTDPLTGLWNYRHLRESMRREVERASRFGRMLTVLVLDLDHFKVVNDTYGHAAGDTVLSEFARRVRAGLREVDVAFRQGGEEFVVLLPETDAYGGTIVAERLGAAVRDIPVPIDSRRGVDRIPISVSIGIAVYPEHGTTAQQVLDAADDALYAAKKAGRDTYCLAEPGVSAAVPSGNPDAATGVQGGPQPPRQGRGR